MIPAILEKPHSRLGSLLDPARRETEPQQRLPQARRRIPAVYGSPQITPSVILVAPVGPVAVAVCIPREPGTVNSIIIDPFASKVLALAIFPVTVQLGLVNPGEPLALHAIPTHQSFAFVVVAEVATDMAVVGAWALPPLS